MAGTSTSAIVTSQTNPDSIPAGSTAVLTVGGLDTPTTFAGVIADGKSGSPAAGVLTGLNVVGGTLTLTDTSTYTGATTVNGGNLVLVATGNISTSSGVTVNSGGTLPGGTPVLSQLSGTGTVSDVTVNSGGTLTRRYGGSSRHTYSHRHPDAQHRLRLRGHRRLDRQQAAQ